MIIADWLMLPSPVAVCRSKQKSVQEGDFFKRYCTGTDEMQKKYVM